MTALPQQMSPDRVEQTAQDWFLRLTAGDMSAVELRRFREWREANPAHDAAFREVRALWNDLDPLEPAFAPAADQVMPHRIRPGISRTRAVAAIAALAACLLLVLASLPDLLIMIQADYRTARGEQATITLPDGSLAYLNTGSALDIRYTQTRREVAILGGEVWFDVIRDRGRPFSVLALGGSSTAVGTAYAVRDQDGIATVTVTEGTVRVAPDATDNTASTDHLVTAGQRIAYREDGSIGPMENVDATAAIAWRQGLLLLRERPFTEALEEIGRYYPGRILLLGDQTKLGTVTARLSLGQLDNGIDALAATHGLSVTRLAGYLVILH
ncbi:MAG: FecR domain-containing protein [Alphaproteobacteria bacterium]|nr:FecR domain-containing protein [Alphaproteobacteria bacterium]MBU0798961.1 FecR domain-containing protein [Alphaproteobacteria bacterium]MBU0886787.1 FecR domain-containing protein [Alphaproteobacteria bacterium]MBU1812471.1 FecR domain-containing protein [Alphaproteobacteria bacterium]